MKGGEIMAKKKVIKRSHHKKILKVVAPVKLPILFIPEDFPEIEEPIVLLPNDVILADPNWIKRAWKWILE